MWLEGGRTSGASTLADSISANTLFMTFLYPAKSLIL